MVNLVGHKERQLSTIKVTPEILDAIARATEYYGNVSSLAKTMGVAHSTVIFWRTGKTESISGRLWVTRIRPVLEPFLTSSSSSLNETHAQYMPNFPVLPPYMENKKEERHEANVIPVSMLKSFDPALETAPVFVRTRCTEKRTFFHECRRSSFAVKIDSLFTDIFPVNCYILAYPDGLQNGCMIIGRLQGSRDLIARRYTKDGNIITLSPLRGCSGEAISWNCKEEIGRLAWCFPLVELNLDLMPSPMELILYEDEDDMATLDEEPVVNADSQKNSEKSTKKRGRKRKQ